MNVLVTGAPGWLGNRLVEAMTTGIDGAPALDKPRVRCLVGPGMDPTAVRRLGAEAREGDVTRPRTLAGVLDGVDTVFHLAGIIHPKRATRDLHAINADGTRNLLEAAAEAGVRRFVHVSSNSVAGTNPDRARPFAEDDPPNPYLEYGKSKLAAEEAVRSYHAAGELETVVLRPCWFYGPAQPLRQTRLFRMIKEGRPLVFGDGRNLRSMSYLDNTVQGLLLAATVDKADGQTYWMADERPYSTLEIYETIARLLDVRDLRPRHVPGLVSEGCLLADRALQAAGLYQMEIHVVGELNKDIAVSVEKAKRELGYRPTVALEEGMRRSIAWCRANGIAI